MPQPIHLKDHEKDARLVRRRVIVGAVAVVLLTLVLVARMYHLQVTQYEYHSTLSENNRVHVQPIPPTRGIIFDRNGVIIADNRPSFSLTITRERTEDLQKTLDTLVEILGLTEDDRAIFEKRMKQGRRPFEPVPIMFELNEEQIARIAVNQFRLPGVDVATQFVRHYPLKEHFAHSVGYVGRINEQELKNLDPINYSGTHHIGKTGIERFYESELHGTVGYEEVETNARGRVLRVLKRTDPIPGKDIVLSIDSRLQEIVPRGGKGLIERISREAKVPVIKHLDGICHVYIDVAADLDKAIRVADNAKTQRYAPCNTMETLLVHAGIAERVLPPLATIYREKGVELRGDAATRALLGADVLEATEEDWRTEYNAPILSIRIVDGLDAAIEHINTYGSQHTDAIITENFSDARRFLAEVDSASVMVNASTRFADGFEYGLGAEIGISTDKLHARGPVGLEGLTSEKYVVFGDGHVRT